ncbi:MAG: hypothetical protein M1814_000621 [Vezdaea aestivalis]|nr:MAG: hypothetical protein M1814_000621 [Vezdaea aestivalis]
MPPSRPKAAPKPLPSDIKPADRKQPAPVRAQHASPAVADPDPQVHYTVFIRLPFPRGEFVDPPPVDWNSAKEKALWAKLSRMVKGNDIDWQTLADEFDVTLQFLLQQAAWLYERQLSQVRAQMRKVGHSSTSATASPVAGSVSASIIAGGYPMKRVGSGGGSTNTTLGGNPMRRDNSSGGLYTPTGGYPMRRDGSGGPASPAIAGVQAKKSDISGGKLPAAGGYPMRKDGSSGGGDAHVPSGKKAPYALSHEDTSKKIKVGRTPSVLSDKSKEDPVMKLDDAPKPSSGLLSQSLSQSTSRQSSLTPDGAPINRPLNTPGHRRPSALSQVAKLKISTEGAGRSPSPSNNAASPPSSSASDSSSSSSSPAMRKSLAFKRPTRNALARRRPSSPFKMSNSRDGDIDPDDDDGSDSDGAFLPFSDPRAAGQAASKASDPSATLKGAIGGDRRAANSGTIDSSTSSANSLPTAQASFNPDSPQHPPGNVSPAFSRAAHHRAHLSRHNPPSRTGTKATRQPGSEGTPTSMGSSYSDLDDAGVTKSGAEEAITNTTGVTSRMSTISQALRSRYL